ncbi:farnesyl diphosphate synthase [Parvibaculum sp.]|jgi:farnesyl diphosphate synthase|uniref:polyprenyl synthetase family protein n=1 Tax=Parvibaculum sp. TaxID=2024848 RepID=UPI000C4DBEC4|nr:farnesyl diphosphate synthase [Parvibaculum sp.]MAU62142.1 farnesyl-diphosphate synthase [Parvibaculum sp.]MBO6667035.1 polyprenyl synthetase family protein [Parvibaculum sp.]MBO6690479.1 polyprenyl synthetase family protein [Parvibaculum sp.]MBO6713656.1 polyprenyl synthetase family protein [Parvibaculum sp.]|tara:strand:- start:1598 stop:2506 length:909 start_codon:yes stop_codon:yes gene_type:complete
MSEPSGKDRSFETALSAAADDVAQMLDRLLPRPEGPEGRLAEAMRYAALGGGKRFRPFLVCQSASLFGVAAESALRAAAAAECVHIYSLVHDDLPAMDDDDLRHGAPSAHREYDEATAILAGDALLTLAFDILADPQTHERARVRVELVRRLARAAGAHGMVGGQMIDLASEGKTLDMVGITRLQQLKTGALISFCCEAGAVLGRASPEADHALHAYAHDMGLAYQIADDILDVEADAATLGKTAGKDAAAGKATFVSILGLERARAQARMLADQAIQHLDLFDERADLLRQAAHFVITRRN